MAAPDRSDRGTRHRAAAHPSGSRAATRALRRAIRVWGDAFRVWDRLDPSWLARVLEAPAAEPTPAEAFDLLRQEHAAEARPEFERIHASWMLRAARIESPAVLRTLLDQAPEPVAAALGTLVPSGADPPRAATAPHADLVACARVLWSERFVGGRPDPASDPPVIVALTGPDRALLVHLIGFLGLAKRAYVPEAAAEPSWSARKQERFGAFQDRWGQRDPRLVQVARLDLAEHAGELAQDLPRLGLVTLARLLTLVEPRRVRWALQHLPYGVAKHVGAQMKLGSPFVSRAMLMAWEERMLALAQERLDTEPLARERAVSRASVPSPAVALCPGPLGVLPFVDARQARLERVLVHGATGSRLRRPSPG